MKTRSGKVFPLDIKTQSGEKLVIGSSEQLRALIVYLEEWVKVFEAAEAIPDLVMDGGRALPVTGESGEKEGKEGA